MECLVTAMIRVRDLENSETGHITIREEARINGNKALTFYQLFEVFKKKVREKYGDNFEKIVYLKITEDVENSQKDELPVSKQAPAK